MAELAEEGLMGAIVVVSGGSSVCVLIGGEESSDVLIAVLILRLVASLSLPLLLPASPRSDRMVPVVPETGSCFPRST